MDEFDWKLLKVERCSNRCMQEIMYAILNTGTVLHQSHIFDYRCMLVNPTWTSGDILVKIPRRMRTHSHVHKTNIEFFTQIKGVQVCEPPAPPRPQ